MSSSLPYYFAQEQQHHGTPRFVWFHRRMWRSKSNDNLRFRVAVVELLPGKFRFSWHKNHVRRVLFKSPVIMTRATPALNDQGRLVWHDDELREVMDRASRVTLILNRMRLALEAWEMEENGIQKLFDRLWKEDQEYYQPTELDHGTTAQSKADEGTGERTR